MNNAANSIFYWYQKASSFTSSMSYLHLNIFWSIFQRFLANPVKMVADFSTREISNFIATVNEKLLFDSLTEITEFGTLSKERERLLVIKTILQEYKDIIFGGETWLNEQRLGPDLYNHLVNPKRIKDKRTGKRRFKLYKVILFKG